MAHTLSLRGNIPRNSLALAFASLGVVFGDIGTSPLYTMREALRPLLAGSAGGDIKTAVLGVISLLLWTVFLIVTVKYVALLMQADNEGEGGILSLAFLVKKLIKHGQWVAIAGIVGIAFFAGDAIITPAMSVLSAVEGLSLISPHFTPYVLPLAIGILLALFIYQHKGTAGMARIFAPVSALWFITMAVMGATHIPQAPQVLLSLNPLYGIDLLWNHPRVAMFICGGVFLAVTGGEALYSDMGQFGKGPIRISWMALVFPALILNYLGQGALVLAYPSTIQNPFFYMVYPVMLAPLVILATLVTVIASQACITGAFSIARQAMALKLFPAMNIVHTNEKIQEQIYISGVNWVLLIGVLLLVVIFRSSANLAAAYGIAVNVSMIASTLLGVVFFWHRGGLSRSLISPFLGIIFIIETVFLFANSLKFLNGGYIPVAIGAVVFTCVTIWRRGLASLNRKVKKDSVRLTEFLLDLRGDSPHRVAGTAVYLQSDPNYAPMALLINVKHNAVLHQRLIFVKVNFLDEPFLPKTHDRVRVTKLKANVWQVMAYFGYMERPDVPASLTSRNAAELNFDPSTATYFLGRRILYMGNGSHLSDAERKIFDMMVNRALRPSQILRIPPDRTVEICTLLSV